MLSRIRIALGSFFRTLPGWLRSQYIRALLLVPAAWIVVVYALADADFMGWGTPGACKALMEVVHPGLLAMGVSIALAGWLLTRNAAPAFLGVLCAFLLLRELSGQGTSFTLYTALLALIVYGYHNQSRLMTLLHSRLACSLIATGFISYAISQLLDRGVIKRIGWLFAQDTLWEPPYSSQIEESLEALGGGFHLVAVLVVVALLTTYRAAKTKRIP